MFGKNEIDVIRGVAHGWSNLEIATSLGWPEQAVAQCLDQVLAQLKISSRIELVFYASTEEGQAAIRQSAA